MLNPSIAQPQTMPNLFIPTIPNTPDEAVATYGRITNLVNEVRELLPETDHYDWLSELVERYTTIALSLDLYAVQGAVWAQNNLERLERQIDELNVFLETKPEDLWPRGP
jgi:hypothetical protein